MKCMIIRKADQDTEAGKMPGEALLLAMARYNEKLVHAGVLADGAGLKPSSFGARIKFSKGVPVVTDGPFTESKEILAGYTMLEVKDFAEALAWARQWPVEDADGEVELEIRPLFGMEDFPEGEGIEAHKSNALKMQRRPSAVSSFLEFADGQCRAAFTHYAEVLGGEITTMMSWGELPMQHDVPKERQSWITHASMNLGSCVVAGIDLVGETAPGHKAGHLLLSFKTPEQTANAYAALIDGGTSIMAPHSTFWTSCFAVLLDRYGVQWSLNCEQAPAAN